MALHVDPDYFVHPSIVAYLLLPVTWVLLPLGGCAPHLLQPHLSATIYRSILDWSVS